MHGLARVRAPAHIGGHTRAVHVHMHGLGGLLRATRCCGHFLTKSRAYSTTFRELRGARADHHRQATRARLGVAGDALIETAREWTYAGRETMPEAAG